MASQAFKLKLTSQVVESLRVAPITNAESALKAIEAALDGNAFGAMQGVAEAHRQQ